MLGSLFKKKPEQVIARELEAKREKLIAQAGKMAALVNDKSLCWAEYCAILDEYVDACRKRKAITALDRADDKTIEALKYIDHEIWFVQTFIKRIPEMIFEKEKAMQEAAKREDG